MMQPTRMLWICLCLVIPSTTFCRPLSEKASSLKMLEDETRIPVPGLNSDDSNTEDHPVLPATRAFRYGIDDKVTTKGQHQVPPSGKRTFRYGTDDKITNEGHHPVPPAKRTFSYGTGIAFFNEDEEAQYLADLELLYHYYFGE